MGALADILWNLCVCLFRLSEVMVY
jgi:hypothetical protein